ncbi:MAG: hypothetical protein ABIH89_09000 [Elusimicrobiota bacterium]
MQNMGLFHYQIFHEILQSSHQIYSYDELSKYAVTRVSRAFNAEGGTMFKLEESGELYPVCFRI